MYQGFGKGDGGIVGSIADDDLGATDFAEVCDAASAEESLVCNAIDESGDPYKIVVSARLCPKSGTVLWERELDEIAVMQRTVGMSQMTSMLHDKDRNSVYERAIEKSIQHFSKHNERSPVVLDIGTGTGLLAMFAARQGAELVIGCEMFETMASIAEEVVVANGYGGTVNVVPVKSSSIETLAPVVPDILVSELLDSALLGEACIYAHADAIERFMATSKSSHEAADDTELLPISQRVMPHSAVVYGTLVQSDEVRRMHDVSDIGASSCYSPWRDEFAKDCTGGWPLLPVHWREVEGRDGRKLSDATPILNFEFFHSLSEGTDSVDGDDENQDKGEDDNQVDRYAFGEGCFQTDVVATSEGIVHAVLVWWKVQLLAPEIDPARECFYSTEPGVMNWQDHWQQCVFPLPAPIHCNVGDIVRVTAAHDALRIWLDAEKAPPSTIISSHHHDDSRVSTSDIHFQPDEGAAGGDDDDDDDDDDDSSSAKRMKPSEESPAPSDTGTGNDTPPTNSNSSINKKDVDVQVAAASLTRTGTMSNNKCAITPVSGTMANNKCAITPVSGTMANNKCAISPVSASERLSSAQCACGWHLLCGGERIQSITDKMNTAIWERAIEKALSSSSSSSSSSFSSSTSGGGGAPSEPATVTKKTVTLSSSSTTDCSSSSGIPHGITTGITPAAAGDLHSGDDTEESAVVTNIILDVSDGSMLAIAAAAKLLKDKSHRRSDDNSNLKVVSVERKLFSRMFHGQLFDANNLSDVAMVWDGVDWTDIITNFSNNEQQVEGDDEEEDSSSTAEGEERSPLLPVVGKLKISALISECFYYQLHTLPTWQAISFLYQRTAVDALLAENAVILPARALVMVAAVELTDLAGTFGAAGIVSGFDHAALDRQQENWHNHKFPYKLAGYRKRLLTAPVVAATLNYVHTATANDISDIIVTAPVVAAGRCDAVAIWVDYDLSSTSSSTSIEDDGKIIGDDGKEDVIRQWDGTDFPCYYKANLKFFPSPIELSPSPSQPQSLVAKTSFKNGDSDFDFNFTIR